MNLTKVILEHTLFLILSIGLLILSFVLFPNVFTKMFFGDPNPGFGDTPYYVGIAKDGYTSDPEWAYYPLYPISVKVFSTISSLPLERSAVVVSIILFMISIPLTLSLFKSYLPSFQAYVFLLLYLTNPMIIFHYLGYTESLFSLLLIGLIVFISNETIRVEVRLILILIVSILLALTRPILIQIIFASLLSFLVLLILDRSRGLNYLFPTLFIVVGSVIGYTFFGLYALGAAGDFLKPFSVQSLWDKKLGIYLNNFWARGTTFDILALYIGLMLSFYLVLIVVRYLVGKSRLKDVMFEYVFWFSFGLLISHVLIVFLTQDGDLRSLGRYVFSIPTTFLMFGMLFKDVSSQYFKIVSVVLVVLSFLSLLYWFYMYSETLWIG